MDDKPTISACMMVKNEEKLLPQCLESIKDVVDEIIIVDTGSKDKTVEIAESYGAKIFHHPWENDFSKHRSQSISYATGDWIFIIDADEVLLPESREEVLKAVKHKSIDSIFATVRSMFEESRGEAVHNSIRFFRNNGIIHYEGRVHNLIVGEKKSLQCPIYMLHYGYNLDAETSKKKFERTTSLLKKDIEDNPENPKAYHYLSASYLSEGLFDKAAKEAMKAIELSEKFNHDDFLYLWSHYIAAFSYINMGKFDQSVDVSLRALRKYPDHLDSHYLLSLAYLEKKEWENFFKHSKEYFRLIEEVKKNPGKFGPLVHNTFNHSWKAFLFLGYAFLENGEEEKANSAFDCAYDKAPDKSEYYWLLGRYFKEKNHYPEAKDNMAKALEHKPEAKKILYDYAILSNTLGDKEEEKRALQRLLGLDPDDSEALFSLANLYLHEAKIEDSLGLYEKILATNKNHLGALTNMGNALRRVGTPEKAIKYLEEAVKASPLSIEANSNLAYAYYESENFRSAREIFQKVCQIDNNLEDIHLYLAIIELKNMDLEACVFECDHLLRILGMPRDEILNGIPDLAEKFIEIGNRFEAFQKSHLTSLACGIANDLLQISTGNRTAMPA